MIEEVVAKWLMENGCSQTEGHNRCLKSGSGGRNISAVWYDDSIDVWINHKMVARIEFGNPDLFKKLEVLIRD